MGIPPCLHGQILYGAVIFPLGWDQRGTDEQLAALGYHAFIKLYVHFEFAHTPADQTPRLEAKKTRPVRKKVTKARV